jgi:hypothetical protein
MRLMMMEKVSSNRLGSLINVPLSAVVIALKAKQSLSNDYTSGGSKEDWGPTSSQ